MKPVLLIVVALLFSSLAFARQQDTATKTQQPTDQQTSAAQKTTSQSTPSEATPQFALLRVYRHRRYAGSSLAPSIYVDEKQVARVENGRCFTARLSAGSHTIRSDDKSSAILLDAKGGQEYFIRVDEEPGFWKGHGKLTMLMPEQGAAEYKLQKPIEPDRRIAKEILENDSESAPPSKGSSKDKNN